MQLLPLKSPSFSWRDGYSNDQFLVRCQKCVQHWILGDPTWSPGNPGRCHGTCCQPYRPGIWRSGDHPSLQARALSQKGYCSNEGDGCIEAYINIWCILYILYIYMCVHISSQWMISNVRSYKALGISAAYATYIQRFLGRFIDVSLFQDI